MTYGLLNGKMTEFVSDCRNRLVKAEDTSYEYDTVQHGKNGNTEKMLSDLGWALVYLLEIITARVASNYLKNKV